jgi:hypothetical protein
MGGACSTYGEMRIVHQILIENPERKSPLGRPRRRWEFTAPNVYLAVLWYVAPWSLVEIYKRFEGSYGLHHRGDEALRSFLFWLNRGAFRLMPFLKSVRYTIIRYIHQNIGCYFVYNRLLSLQRRNTVFISWSIGEMGGDTTMGLKVGLTVYFLMPQSGL